MASETIDKNGEGAWRVYGSDAAGYLVTRVYYGYTRREALARYRAEMRQNA